MKTVDFHHDFLDHFVNLFSLMGAFSMGDFVDGGVVGSVGGAVFFVGGLPVIFVQVGASVALHCIIISNKREMIIM